MMKNLFRIGLVALPFIVSAETSTPKGFTDDLDAALVSAKESGKFVYACFSGSDWCRWCIKLEKEVFSKDVFAASVTNEYELVFIDSPNDKSRLSESAKERNPALTKKYGINGFPTMIVFDGKDGSEVKRATAYRPGGPEAYAKFLLDVKNNGAELKRLEALEAEWVQSGLNKHRAIFRDLNFACDKWVNEQLAKPENKKTRQELMLEAKVIVKEFVPKFKALVTEIEAKVEKAPAEVKDKVAEQAKTMGAWLKRVEADVK